MAREVTGHPARSAAVQKSVPRGAALLRAKRRKEAKRLARVRKRQSGG